MMICEINSKEKQRANSVGVIKWSVLCMEDIVAVTTVTT